MMDYLNLIPFSAFISVFYILAYVSGQRKKSVVNNSFLLFFFFLMLPPLIDFLIHLPLPEEFRWFLYRISMPILVTLGFLFLNFVFALINKKRDLAYWLCLTVITGLAVYLYIHPQISFTFFSGYAQPLPVPSFGFIVPFFFTLLIIPFHAFLLCLKYVKKENNIILFRQLRLVAIGACVSTSITVFTLFGHLFFHSYLLLRFSSLGIIINAVFMFIAVQRHFFLSVNIDQIENTFNRLFENSHDSVILLDKQGDAIQVNNSALSLLGSGILSNTRAFLEEKIPGYDFSKNVIDKNTTFKNEAEIKHLQISQSLVNNSNTSLGKLLIVRDISLHKKAEQLMLNSKNIDSLGRLAGGIAHDFNNFLCGIVSNLSLTKMYVAPSSKAAELITLSEKSALSARDLARQLLTFSKADSRKIEVFDLVDLINETSSFISHGSSTLISVDLPKTPVFIEADKGQIRQVFQNIIINGLESMTNGKTLRIRGKTVYLQEKIAPHNREGNYFEVAIADQGIGIPEEYLSRIFEPYFTTKPNGSGIGLAIVDSVVSRIYGSISVISQLNKGSVFTIRLPIVLDEVKQEILHSKHSDIQHGRILIMDDSATVRLSLALLLQQLGFTVDQASSGNQALELYERTIQNKISYQAVITDLTVPGAMGGRELAFELKKRDPTLRIIVSSGYSEEVEISRYKDFGFSGVLHKPYSTEELENALNSVLSLSEPL